MRRANEILKAASAFFVTTSGSYVLGSSSMTRFADSHMVAPRTAVTPCLRSTAAGPRLAKQPNVISAGPVLDDPAIDDAPDVHVGPRHRGARRLDASQQRHSRCSMRSMQSHVVGDELALGDEVVVLDGEVFAEVVFDDPDDLLPPLATLAGGTGGIVDHVLGEKLVDGRPVPSTEQLFDDALGICAHRDIVRRL